MTKRHAINLIARSCFLLAVTIFYGCANHHKFTMMYMPAPSVSPKDNAAVFLDDKDIVPKKAIATIFVIPSDMSSAGLKQSQRLKVYLELTNNSFEPFVFMLHSVMLDGYTLPFYQKELVLEAGKSRIFELGYNDITIGLPQHKVVFDYSLSDKRTKKEFVIYQPLPERPGAKKKGEKR